MQTDINNIPMAHDFISGLLLQLNISLSSYDEFPRNLNRALKTIGEFSHHDRIHIVEVHSNMTFTVEHTWSDKQLEAVAEKWKHSKVIYDSLLEEQLCSQNYIAIYDNQLNPDSDLLTILKEQQCHQMLALPLFESGAQFAFIIFMKCKETQAWKPEEIQMLTDLASIIATHLNNYHLIKRLLHREKKRQQSQEPVEVLHHQLKQLHTELMPTWEKIKNSYPEIQQSIPVFFDLDRHISNLDKICHNLAVK